MQPVIRSRGFTLIELMIVVAIVAVLAAIAIPSYSQYAIRAARTAAEGDLIENAQYMERRFTAEGTYASVTNANLPVPTSPRDANTLYNITFTANPTATAFTLQAVPVAGTQQAGDSCGTLTYSSTGVKCAAGNCSNGNASQQEAQRACW